MFTALSTFVNKAKLNIRGGFSFNLPKLPPADISCFVFSCLTMHGKNNIRIGINERKPYIVESKPKFYT